MHVILTEKDTVDSGNMLVLLVIVTIQVTTCKVNYNLIPEVFKVTHYYKN